MKIWFTSDFHLKHSNIINYCNRPFKNVEEMHEVLIKNWNKNIHPNDLVYCLGDMMFSSNPTRDRPLIERLNGTKILIRGNHDGRPNVMLNCGFSAVLDQAILQIGKERVLLSHRPYAPKFSLYKLLSGKWKKSWYRKNPKDNGLFLLHGHSHNKPEFRIRDRMFDVGVDANYFKPVGIWEIGNWIAEYKQNKYK